jgi:hypothetical protein
MSLVEFWLKALKISPRFFGGAAIVDQDYFERPTLILPP